MTASGFMWQIAFGWLAVSTPWLVVQIVSALAPPEAADIRHAGRRRLDFATLLALVAIAAVGMVTVPPSLMMGVADILGFAVMSAVAWPCLLELDFRTRASRNIDVQSRVASLRRRQVSDYLSPLRRAVPIVIAAVGGVAMVLRLLSPVSAGQRRFLPVAFALVAVALLWLYHRWIDEEVRGAQVADQPSPDSWRTQRVRSIYAWQVLLVVAFSILGQLLLNVNWVSDPTWGMTAALAGAVLGVVGCARALASDLHSKRYRQISRAGSD